jgi:hypothetical protein
MKRLLPFTLAPAGLLFAGCRYENHAPTLDVLGSYFPAWMICIILGLVFTLIARQVFIATRIDLYLKFAGLVYTCLFVFFTILIWLLFFQN